MERKTERGAEYDVCRDQGVVFLNSHDTMVTLGIGDLEDMINALEEVDDEDPEHS